MPREEKITSKRICHSLPYKILKPFDHNIYYYYTYLCKKFLWWGFPPYFLLCLTFSKSFPSWMVCSLFFLGIRFLVIFPQKKSWRLCFSWRIFLLASFIVKLYRHGKIYFLSFLIFHWMMFFFLSIFSRVCFKWKFWICLFLLIFFYDFESSFSHGRILN